MSFLFYLKEGCLAPPRDISGCKLGCKDFNQSLSYISMGVKREANLRFSIQPM